MKNLIYILFLVGFVGTSQFVGNRDFLFAGGPDLSELIAYYKFNNDYTDSYNSYDGTGASQGTGSNPSFTTSSGGVIDEAVITVGGTNSEYVTIADNDVFSFTDGAGTDEAFTISVWVYSSSGDNRGWFVNRRTSGSIAEYQMMNNNGVWALNIFDTSGTSIYIGKSFTLTMPTSTWVHFAVTYDGSETEGGIKLYKDGSLQSMSSSSAGTYTGMGNEAILTYIGVFGQIPTSSTTGFDGQIDLVQIWNRELSGTEISDNYDLENAGTHITD